MDELKTDEIFPPTIKAIEDERVKLNSEGVETLDGRVWTPCRITDLERFTEAWDASLALHDAKQERTRNRREHTEDETDGETYQRLSDSLTDFGASTA